MLRKILLASAVLIAMWAAPAAAQYGPVITPSDGVVAPGETVTISGQGFPANTSGTVVLGGQVLATFTTDADGTFSVDVALPAGLAAGTYTLVASAGGASTETTVQVPGDDGAGTGTGGVGTAGTGGQALPRTGGDDDLSTMALVGAGLVVLGGVAFAGSRRRAAAR